MTDSPLRKSLVSIKEPLPVTAQNRVRVAQGGGQVKRGRPLSGGEATIVTLAQQRQRARAALRLLVPSLRSVLALAGRQELLGVLGDGDVVGLRELGRVLLELRRTAGAAEEV